VAGTATFRHLQESSTPNVQLLNPLTIINNWNCVAEHHLEQLFSHVVFAQRVFKRKIKFVGLYALKAFEDILCFASEISTTTENIDRDVLLQISHQILSF
jgi:hypothetical protein